MVVRDLQMVAMKAEQDTAKSDRHKVPVSPVDAVDETPAPVDATQRTDNQRRELLSEYRKASGDPSHRKIYTARNSGINKPEFYAWIRGELPDTSKTTIKFEKFLRSKKRPIPKIQKHL